MELKESHLTMLFWLNQPEPIRYEYYQSTIATDLIAWGLAKTFLTKSGHRYIQITEQGVIADLNESKKMVNNRWDKINASER